MTPIPGTQIEPYDVQFKDGLTNVWSAVETPFATNKRSNFKLNPSKKHIRVDVIGTTPYQKNIAAGANEADPNIVRDNATGFNSVFYYEQA